MKELKIVHSFWSKPAGIRLTGEHSRFSGGWMTPYYHYMSWNYSVLKFREFYPKIALVTDSNGKRLLIDQLGLPYDEVDDSLDAISHYPPHLWALGKIYAYGLQNSPFIHADADVFIWEALNCNPQEDRLLAQNEEADFPKYAEWLDIVNRSFTGVPDCLRSAARGPGPLVASNAGVIGGCDTEFYQRFSRAAFRLIDANMDRIVELASGEFNLIAEQLLFHQMALEEQIPVKHLFRVSDPGFTEVMAINKVPLWQKYIHFVGSAKQEFWACEQLRQRFRFEYPDAFREYNQRYLAFNPDSEVVDLVAGQPLFELDREHSLHSLYELLYSDDSERLLNARFVLNSRYRFMAAEQEDQSAVYWLEATNPGEAPVPLTDFEGILSYFTTPVSVNEILGQAQAEGCNEAELNNLGLALIELVTEKQVVNGILKPA